MTSSGLVGTTQVSSTIFEWEIQNYSSYRSLTTGYCIHSPSFCYQKNNWRLQLYPNGTYEASQNYVSLFLKKLDSQIEPIESRFGLSIYNNEKKRIGHWSSKVFRKFDIKDPFKGKHRFVLSSVIQSDTITIMCEIFAKDVMINRTLLVNSSIQIKTFKAFKSYHNNNQFSDVKIIVEQKEIFAHKMVLAANSKVFDAMFNHEMRENKDSLVIIEDIKYEVFQELLRFVYTGESYISQDIATELLRASDKYELLSLKDLCEREICKNLSTNNVIEYLHVAHTYNAQCLKKEAIDFIVSHGQEMIDHPEFDSLRTLDANLFKDVFRSVFCPTAQPNKKPKLA